MNANIKKFASEIATGVTLIGLDVALKGIYAVLLYVVAGIIILKAVILMFNKYKKSRILKYFVKQAEEIDKIFDSVFAGFGFSILLLGSTYISKGKGFEWGGVLIMLMGVVFMGMSVGEIIGQKFVDVVEKDYRKGWIVSGVYIAVGVAMMIANWGLMLHDALVNAPMPGTLIVLGVLMAYACLRKWRKIRKEEVVVNNS